MKRINLILSLSLFLCLNLFGQEETTVEAILQKGHIQPISKTAWHPSSDYFVTASDDNSIILWSVKSGKQVRSFNYHTGSILNVHFSKDGTQLLSSSYDNYVYVMDVLTGDLLEKYYHRFTDSYPMSVAFSPSEKYILIGDNRDRLTSIDRATKIVQERKKGFSASAASSYFSKEETHRLELVNYNHFYLINQVANDSLKVDFDKAYSYSFHPSKNQFIVASEKLKATVFDYPSGKVSAEIIMEKQCDGCKLKVGYNHDGSALFTYDKYSGLFLFNTSSYSKPVFTLNTELEYDLVEWSPKGTYILMSNSKECKIIYAKTGATVNFFKNEHLGKLKPKMSPDERWVLLGDDYFTVSSYLVKTGAVHQRFKGYLNTASAQVKQIDYASWFDRNIVNHIKFKPAIALSSDGKYLAQGKTDTVVSVFNLETGRRLMPFRGHSDKVLVVAFHPSNKLLVTGDADGKIALWNIETNELLYKKRVHSGPVLDLAFSEKGDELLSSGWDAYVKHWELNNQHLNQVGYIDLKNISAYSVGFSPNDLYIVVGDVFENIHFYEADTKKEVLNLIGHTSTVSKFVFFKAENDRDVIASASRDGWVKIWDLHSGMLVDKVKTENGAAVLSLVYSQKQRKLYFGSSDRNIYSYNLKSRTLTHQFQGHQTGVNFLDYQPQNNKLFSKSVEGEVKIWSCDEDNITEDLTFFQMSGSEWLISHALGYFDGSKEAMKQINYVSGMRSLQVETFFKKYYHPGLYDYLIKGNRFVAPTKDQGLNQLMDDLPRFELYFQNFQGNQLLVNQDSIYLHNSSSIDTEITFLSGGKEADEIQVFNNGKLLLQQSVEEDVVFRSLAKKRQITLPLVPGTNELTIRLTTKKGLSTPEQRLSIHFDTLSGKQELFILSLGINEYENSTYNLKYARNDANAVVETLKKGSSDLFYAIYDYQLSNKKVTRKNVLEIVEKIKQKMGPEDVFVFFYAGHGIMYTNDDKSTDFYLVMSDITNLYGEKTMLDNQGLSAKDLLDISKNLPAQKQVFVLDACHSGAALNELATRGVERERALAQLARNTGTFFLTASQDIQLANESGYVGHGLFTYAILELLTGQSTTYQKNDIVSIYQLKSYVESRVPELSKEFKGSPQYPTGYSFGNDFPIGVVR